MTVDRTPTFSQVIRNALDQRVAHLRVAMPGRIEAFDATKQTADVLPLLSDLIINAEGEERTESHPVISSVPVQFAGGSGYAATFPVAVGDPCLLVFCDRSIDTWFARGAVDLSNDGRTHDLTDCVAILGVRAEPGKLAEFDTARAVFGNKGPRVAADGAAVHIGVGHNESGTQDAARGTALVNALDQLLATIDTALAAVIVSSQAQGAALNVVLPGLGASSTAIGTALQSVTAAIATFRAQLPSYTTPKIKMV